MSCSNIPSDFYDGCGKVHVVYTWRNKEGFAETQNPSSRKYESYSKEYLTVLQSQMVEEELYEDAAEIRDEITLRNSGAI